MKSNFLKVWYYVVAGLSGFSIFYFVLRAIVQTINPDNITGVYRFFDYISISFLGLALLMLISLIPIAKIGEAKEAKIAAIKASEAEKLAKYKKKK